MLLYKKHILFHSEGIFDGSHVYIVALSWNIVVPVAPQSQGFRVLGKKNAWIVGRILPTWIFIIACHLTDRHRDLSPIVNVLLSASLHARKTFERMREVHKSIRSEKESKIMKIFSTPGNVFNITNILSKDRRSIHKQRVSLKWLQHYFRKFWVKIQWLKPLALRVEWIGLRPLRFAGLTLTDDRLWRCTVYLQIFTLRNPVVPKGCDLCCHSGK
jgi:hypothetical protein